jgi:hypothetical protein
VRKDSKCQASGFVHHSSSFFLQQQFKNFATAVMAQSSRAVGRGQKKGKDFPTNVVPPSFSTGSASVLLSHIVVKGSRLSKFTACTRNVEAQRLEQFVSGSKCKQQARSTSIADIPENIRSAIRRNQGFEILLKLFVEGPEVRSPEAPEVQKCRNTWQQILCFGVFPPWGFSCFTFKTPEARRPGVSLSRPIQMDTWRQI